MSQQEASLVAVQDRASALASEAERSHHTAKSDAATLLEQARSEAGALVASAREQAERIKRDSDRELAAATARRDSITAQLTNVRQMLATLGGAGASMFSPLTGHDEPTPVTAATAEAVTVEAVTAEADAVEQSVAQDTDVEQIADIPDLAEELLAEADGKAGRRG